MFSSIDTLKLDRSVILADLESHGHYVGGKSSFPCPFHEDINPSANLWKNDKGVWYLICHAAGCRFSGTFIDVRAKLRGVPAGEIVREVLNGNSAPPRSQPRPQPEKKKRVFASIKEMERNLPGKHTATYLYLHPKTRRADVVVLRYWKDGKKGIMQASPVVGGFSFGGIPSPWPLYNRLAMREAETVVVVEGEKVCDFLQRYGIVATTSLAGAGKAKYADWTPLEGKKVILWPDNDEGGIQHMVEVRECLSSLPNTRLVGLVDPTKLGLQEKGDAADLVDVCTEEIQGILDNAQQLGPAAELTQLLEDTISGKRTTVTWPWPSVGLVTKALLPDSITLIVGTPGASKSFFLLEAAQHWYDEGIKFAIYELEKDRAFHLNRILAQKAENEKLTNTDWIFANPDETREANERFRDFQDGFGECIYTAHGTPKSIQDISAWVTERCKEGNRIVCVDPITMASKGARSWQDDEVFLAEVQIAARKYGSSIVLVTHPKTIRKSGTPQMNDIAGGAAYERFVDTILWLSSYEQKRVEVESNYGNEVTKINRLLWVLKARNAKGAFVRIGMNFNNETLRLNEVGIILKEVKKLEQ
jgi:hypothetical protein